MDMTSKEQKAVSDDAQKGKRHVKEYLFYKKRKKKRRKGGGWQFAEFPNQES